MKSYDIITVDSNVVERIKTAIQYLYDEAKIAPLTISLVRFLDRPTNCTNFERHSSFM